MDENREKVIVITLAFIYEWIFVTLLGDGTKQGYVINNIENISTDQIIDDVKNINTDDFSSEDKYLIEKLIYNYENYGISEKFLSELIILFKNNSTISLVIQSNPIMKTIFPLI